MTTSAYQGRYTIFRDDTGRLRVEATDEGSPVIADFLFTDIREDRSRCNSVLDMVEHARTSPDAQIETVGNLYVMILRRAGVHIENLFDERAPSADIDLDELFNLLHIWKSKLT